jgi:Dolichyl-phosphate-mannose-protein mannosyltransferase
VREVFHAGWRSAVLAAALAGGLFVTVTTEVLSLFGLVTFGGVTAVWGIALLLVIGASWRAYVTRAGRIPGSPVRASPGDGPRSIHALEWGLAAALGMAVALIGLTALLAPPNTWDSMTYHMARVAHWIQNRTVAHYPTHITRQFYQPPWAEYAIMHLQILSGGDRLANLVQFFSLIGSAVGASLIAGQLGADSRGQLLAAVIVAAIPMGILQASSTQNDYVVTLWLVILAYACLVFKARPTWASAGGIGAALGLAVLTKGTAYLYAPPLLFMLAPTASRARAWRRIVPALALVMLPVALNLGHYARNYELTRNPLVSAPGVVNDTIGVGPFVSNTVRSVALHLGTPFREVNEGIVRNIRLGLGTLGVDPDDPRTTWAGMLFGIRETSTHEDRAGNPLHLILVAWAVAACLLKKELREHRFLLGYLVALIAASSLFALVLKWQPWHSRLHLPLFVLWSPVVAVALARTVSRKAAVAIGLVLTLASLPWLLTNRNRPLLGDRSVLSTPRGEQYFIHRPFRREQYETAARLVRTSGCREIGIVSGEDDWEYPLWVLLDAVDGRRPAVRMEHVEVRNPSAARGRVRRYRRFSPCLIVALDGRTSQEIEVKGAVYGRQWLLGRISVFTRR